MSGSVDRDLLRARLERASTEDNCGGSERYVAGYRQAARDLLLWLDTGASANPDDWAEQVGQQ